MNRDDVIRMAQEAGMKITAPALGDLPELWNMTSTAELERLVGFAQAANQEECVNACKWERLSEPQGEDDHAYNRAIHDCVDAIKKLGKP